MSEKRAVVKATPTSAKGGGARHRSAGGGDIPGWLLLKMRNDSLLFKRLTSYRELKFFIYPYEISYENRHHLTQQVQRFFGEVGVDYLCKQHNVVAMPDLRRFTQPHYAARIKRILGSGGASARALTPAPAHHRSQTPEPATAAAAPVPSFPSSSLTEPFSESSSLAAGGDSADFTPRPAHRTQPHSHSHSHSHAHGNGNGNGNGLQSVSGSGGGSKKARLSHILSHSNSRHKFRPQQPQASFSSANGFVPEMSEQQVEDHMLRKLVRAACRDKGWTPPPPSSSGAGGMPPSGVLFVNIMDLARQSSYFESQLWEFHVRRGIEVRTKDLPGTMSCVKQKCEKDKLEHNPQTHVFRNMMERQVVDEQSGETASVKTPLVPLVWANAPRLSPFFIDDKQRKAQQALAADLELKFREELEVLRREPRVFFRAVIGAPAKMTCYRCGKSFPNLLYFEHVKERGHVACEQTQQNRLYRFVGSFDQQRARLTALLAGKEKKHRRQPEQLPSPEPHESIILHHHHTHLEAEQDAIESEPDPDVATFGHQQYRVTHLRKPKPKPKPKARLKAKARASQQQAHTQPHNKNRDQLVSGLEIPVIGEKRKAATQESMSAAKKKRKMTV